MRFFYHPRCSTCKKALEALHQLKQNPECIDLLTTPPSKEDFLHWQKQFQLPWKKFLNTSGMLYRQENYKEKTATLEALPEAARNEAFATLLSQNPMLIKRPICADEHHLLLGFHQAVYEETFGGNTP